MPSQCVDLAWRSQAIPVRRRESRSRLRRLKPLASSRKTVAQKTPRFLPRRAQGRMGSPQCVRVCLRPTPGPGRDSALARLDAGRTGPHHPSGAAESPVRLSAGRSAVPRLGSQAALAPGQVDGRVPARLLNLPAESVQVQTEAFTEGGTSAATLTSTPYVPDRANVTMTCKAS